MSEQKYERALSHKKTQQKFTYSKFKELTLNKTNNSCDLATNKHKKLNEFTLREFMERNPQKSQKQTTYQIKKLRWIPIINAYDPKRLKNLTVKKQQFKHFFVNHNPGNDSLGQLFMSSILTHFNEWKKKINKKYSRVIDKFITEDFSINIGKVEEELKQIDIMTSQMRQNLHYILSKYENHKVRHLLEEFEISFKKSEEGLALIQLVYESKQKIQNIMIKLEGKKRIKNILKNLRDNKINEAKQIIYTKQHNTTYNQTNQRMINKISQTINQMTNITYDAVVKIEDLKAIILRIKAIVSNKDQELGMKQINSINEIFIEVIKQTKAFQEFSVKLEANTFFSEDFKNKIYYYQNQMIENKNLMTNTLFRILDQLLNHKIIMFQKYQSVSQINNNQNFELLKVMISNLSQNLEKDYNKQIKFLVKYGELFTNNLLKYKQHALQLLQITNSQDNKFIDLIGFTKLIKHMIQITKQYKVNVKSILFNLIKLKEQLNMQQLNSFQKRILQQQQQNSPDQNDDQINYLQKLMKLSQDFQKSKKKFQKYLPTTEISIFDLKSIQKFSISLIDYQKILSKNNSIFNQLKQLNQQNPIKQLIPKQNIKSNFIQISQSINQFLLLTNEINKKNALTKFQESFIKINQFKNYHSFDKFFEKVLIFRLYHITQPQRISICKTHIQKLIETNKDYSNDLQQALQKRQMLISLLNSVKNADQSIFKTQLNKVIHKYDQIEKIHNITQGFFKNKNTYFPNLRMITVILDKIFSTVFLHNQHSDEMRIELSKFVKILKYQFSKLEDIKNSKIYNDSQIVHIQVDRIMQILNNFIDHIKNYISSYHKIIRQEDIISEFIKLMKAVIQFLDKTNQKYTCLLSNQNQPIYLLQNTSYINAIQRLLIGLALPINQNILAKIKEKIIEENKMSQQKQLRRSQTQKKTKFDHQNSTTKIQDKIANSEIISDYIQEIVQDQQILQNQQIKHEEKEKVSSIVESQVITSELIESKAPEIIEQFNQVEQIQSQQVVSQYEESSIPHVHKSKKHNEKKLNDKKENLKIKHQQKIQQCNDSKNSVNINSIMKIISRNQEKLTKLTTQSNTHTTASRRINNHFFKSRSNVTKPQFHQYFKVTTITSIQKLKQSINKYLKTELILSNQIKAISNFQAYNNIYFNTMLIKKIDSINSQKIISEINLVKQDIKSSLSDNIFYQAIIGKGQIPKLLSYLTSLEEVFNQDNFTDETVFYTLTKNIADFLRIFNVQFDVVCNAKNNILFFSQPGQLFTSLMPKLLQNVNLGFNQQETKDITDYYFKKLNNGVYLLSHEEEFNYEKNNETLKEIEEKLMTNDLGTLYQFKQLEGLYSAMWSCVADKTEENMKRLKNAERKFIDEIKKVHEQTFYKQFKNTNTCLLQYKRDLQDRIKHFTESLRKNQGSVTISIQGEVTPDIIAGVTQKLITCTLWTQKLILFEEQCTKMPFYVKSVESKTTDLQIIKILANIMLPKLNIQLDSIVKIENKKGKRSINLTSIFNNLKTQMNSSIKLHKQIAFDILSIINQKYLFDKQNIFQWNVITYKNQIQILKSIEFNRIALNNTIKNYQNDIEEMINVRKQILSLFQLSNNKSIDKNEYEKVIKQIINLQKYFEMNFSIFYSNSNELLLAIQSEQNREVDLQVFQKLYFESENKNLYDKLLKATCKKQNNNKIYVFPKSLIKLSFQLGDLMEHASDFRLIVKNTQNIILYSGPLKNTVQISQDKPVIMLIIEVYLNSEIISQQLINIQIQELIFCGQIIKQLSHFIKNNLIKQKSIIELSKIEQQSILKQEILNQDTNKQKLEQKVLIEESKPKQQIAKQQQQETQQLRNKQLKQKQNLKQLQLERIENEFLFIQNLKKQKDLAQLEVLQHIKKIEEFKNQLNNSKLFSSPKKFKLKSPIYQELFQKHKFTIKSISQLRQQRMESFTENKQQQLTQESIIISEGVQYDDFDGQQKLHFQYLLHPQNYKMTNSFLIQES